MKQEALSFVSIEGLLAYGEALSERSEPEGVSFPPPLPPAKNRAAGAKKAMPLLRAFATGDYADAAAYRAAKSRILEGACQGDPLVFYAAWNALLAEGGLAPLYRAKIGSTRKPMAQRPIAIVPRKDLSPRLTEDRIVIDLGDERFWLLPKSLSGRTLLFAMRHGVSRVESKCYKVGRRLANHLDEGEGIERAEALGVALARMLGLVGLQLDFLKLENYLQPEGFKHFISKSPNTRQLFECVLKTLMPNAPEQPNPLPEASLASQDFGWATGMKKALEMAQAASAFGVDEASAKRLLKHPLYCYPGGHAFFDLYVDVVDGLHQLAKSQSGGVACLYTHSSSLRALITYLDPRPFHEAFKEFGTYKEGQDNVVLLSYEGGQLSGYSSAVGLSDHERAARNTSIALEKRRLGRVTLKPGQIRRLVALVSGGDFSGAGAALKELRATGEQKGIAVSFVRHGFLGLANNWITAFSEQDMRGMAKQASSPIGSSRFEDFKDEAVQRAAIRNLSPYLKDGALVVIGGDGSLRGARAIFEDFGVQVVGLPGTIDDNIAGTTSLGFHSAIALANASLESLKATSAAMGSIFFVELMGAGSGHLALACAYQARAEGVLVNEHPDPDAYIEKAILGSLKQSLGVPNKSHLFIVAEKTPHRHHTLGGVHGLVEYVSETIATWPQRRFKQNRYPMAVATKATILGHTLRGAPPVPEDKILAQDLAYEAIQRLIERPDDVVGCLLQKKGGGEITALPLHKIQAKPFDWSVFSRMHASDVL